MMNILNGGVHAHNAIDLQEFMVMPVGAPTIGEAVRCGAEIFQALRKRLSDAGLNTNVGDEGGFAPDLAGAGATLEFIMRAIEDAGYAPGDGVAIALDPASSEFYRNGRYELEGEGRSLTSDELVAYYVDLCRRFPIVSIETAWPRTTGRVGPN